MTLWVGRMSGTGEAFWGLDAADFALCLPVLCPEPSAQLDRGTLEAMLKQSGERR